jgi:hypothetical protein
MLDETLAPFTGRWMRDPKTRRDIDIRRPIRTRQHDLAPQRIRLRRTRRQRTPHQLRTLGPLTTSGAFGLPGLAIRQE